MTQTNQKQIRAWARGFEAAEAASLLSTAPQFGYRMGSALFAGNKPLCFGFNDWDKTTPHSHLETHNGNVHAEAMCLVRRWHYDKPRNLILYVFRATTNPQQTKTRHACSRPCNPCMNLIRVAGVNRVRFYDEQGQPVEIKINQL